MIIKRTAVEFLFDYFISMPDQHRAPWTKLGPGQVVLNMSPEKRELLKTLKSEDLNNIRPDVLFGTPERQKEWGCEPPKTKGRWGRRLN